MSVDAAPSTRWRGSIVASCLFVLLLSSADRAFAHARLIKSQPSSAAQLTVSPTRIALWFSEQPEFAFSTIEVSDQTGQAIATGAVRALSNNGLEVPLTATLAPGRYRVKYRVLSQDGHLIKASLKFTLKLSEGH